MRTIPAMRSIIAPSMSDGSFCSSVLDDRKKKRPLLGETDRKVTKLSAVSTATTTMFALQFVCFLVLCCCTTTIQAGWVDPDTPNPERSTRALTEGDDRQYELVFSDEFNVEGRNFHDGSDPRWTSIDKNDYTNMALHFYSPDNTYTKNGTLNIVTEQKINWYKAFDEKKKTFYADKKHIQTGMVQGWNKFCFIGGIVEFRAKLPGEGKIGGLWPALWLLGNLARATYVGSSDFIWPFSYNKCSKSGRMSQEINACSRMNHYGMEPFRGRGAPEIDVIESMQGSNEKLPSTNITRPYQSCSFQVSPGIEVDRPVLGHRPEDGRWYSPLEYGNNSDLNPFFYGVTLVHAPASYTYQSDALSANMALTESHYHEMHNYRIEWEPPQLDGSGGYIKWFTDDELVYGVFGESLSIMGTEIPSEPLYLIMNTAVSSHWGFPMPCPEGCECDCFECGNPRCLCGLPRGYCDNFPANFEIDYVRVYQAVNESKHYLGCSPAHRPTADFIAGHSKRFTSEGQTHPLKEMEQGGGACLGDLDCGGPSRGRCDQQNKKCACMTSWTGPNCLAHNAFYDVDTSVHPKNLSLSSIMMPPSLVIVLVILAVGFFCSMIGTIRLKARDSKYRKIVLPMNEHVVPTSLINNNNNSSSASVSYQHQDEGQYTLPPKQKDVTYCVIDGRLVDN